jgi:hypothetical protein
MTKTTSEIAAEMVATPAKAAAFMRGRAEIVGADTLHGAAYLRIAEMLAELDHPAGLQARFATAPVPQVAVGFISRTTGRLKPAHRDYLQRRLSDVTAELDAKSKILHAIHKDVSKALADGLSKLGHDPADDPSDDVSDMLYPLTQGVLRALWAEEYTLKEMLGDEHTDTP